MESLEQIGARIKDLRDSRNLTQKQLADALKVKRETVNQWEHGSRDLKTFYIESLADFFGVTCDYIIRGVASENVDIHRRTGLSDQAIKALEFMKEDISINVVLGKKGEIKKISSHAFMQLRLINALIEDTAVTGDISLLTMELVRCMEKDNNEVFVRKSGLYFEIYNRMRQFIDGYCAKNKQDVLHGLKFMSELTNEFAAEYKKEINVVTSTETNGNADGTPK